jgi:hypothetical protein
VCERSHSPGECWVEHPEKAPLHRRKQFERRYQKWKETGKIQAKITSDEEYDLRIVIQQNRQKAQLQEQVQQQSSRSTHRVSESAFSCPHQADGYTSWIIDSGASTHATSNLSLLTDVQIVEIMVMTANGLVHCNKRGTVEIMVTNDKGVSRLLRLPETLYIPNLGGNLLSVARTLSGGLCFRPDLDALVNKSGKIVTNLQLNQYEGKASIYNKGVPPNGRG